MAKQQKSKDLEPWTEEWIQKQLAEMQTNRDKIWKSLKDQGINIDVLHYLMPSLIADVALSYDDSELVIADMAEDSSRLVEYVKGQNKEAE